jgi:hypothetical protein
MQPCAGVSVGCIGVMWDVEQLLSAKLKLCTRVQRSYLGLRFRGVDHFHSFVQVHGPQTTGIPKSSGTKINSKKAPRWSLIWISSIHLCTGSPKN